jgi:predicted phage-related endonuclease
MAAQPLPATPEVVIDYFQRWLDSRRYFIGGSEAFELLNQAQYGKGCRTTLAFRKLGVEPDFPEMREDDAILRRGRILEPLVGMLYEEQTGRRVRRPPMDEGGMPKTKRHPDYSWAGVSTDRIILTGFGGVTETGDLEIKTRNEGPFLRVKRMGPFPGDLLQSQWSLFVTGHQWGALATLGVFGGLPLSHFDAKRDEELIDIFKREGDAFATDVWVKGIAPAPTIAHDDQRCKVCEYRLTCRGEEVDRAEAAAIREIKKSKKNLILIENATLAKTLADIDLMKGEKKSIEEAIDVAEDRALAEMGDIDAALVRGYGKAYVMDSQANYLDAQRLKAEKPDIHADYFVSKKTGDHFIRTYPEKIA